MLRPADAGTTIQRDSAAPSAPPRPAAPPRVTLRESLRILGIYDFRLLLLGNVLAFVGYQVRVMAQAWLVLDLTDSSLKVGIVNATPGIAIIFWSLIGGAVADRFERRLILIWTKFVIAGTAFLIAFLVTGGWIEWWHLVPIGLVMGTMFAFHNPASQTFVADVVGKERLLSAASLNTTISNVANIAGPAAGGFMLAAGMEMAFYLLGALYGGGWLASLLIRGRGAPMPAARKNLAADIAAGVRYAANTPVIKWMLILAATSLFTGVFQAVIPLYARNILDVGEKGYGAMLSVQGAGSLAGSAALIVAGNVRRKGAVMFFANVVITAATLVFALSGIYALSLAAMFFYGAALGVMFVMVPTILQVHCEPEMRGRVMSIFFIAVLLSQLGWIAGGLLDTSIGTHATAVVASVSGLILTTAAFARSAELRRVT